MLVLNDPIVSSVFVQANTVRGFRFWDETGVLANRFSERFRSVTYQTAIGELRCVQPLDAKDSLGELRVNTSMIWLSYRAGVSWTTVRQDASSVVDWIARGIHVTQYSRIGMRVNLLWGGKDRDHVHEVQRNRVLCVRERKWTELGEVAGGDLVIQLKFNRVGARVAISAVQNIETQIRTKIPDLEAEDLPAVVPLPDYAIMADIDLAEERLSDSIDIKPHLNRSIDLLQAEIIPFINKLFEEEDQ